MHIRRAITVAIFLVVVFPAAATAGSGEHMLSIRPEYSYLEAHGAGLSLGYQWGIDDVFNLWVDGGWIGIPSSSRTEISAISHRLMASIGVSYHLDAFQWVPYLSTSVGFYGAFVQDGSFRPGLGFELGGGVDYRPVRRWSIGIFGMFHAIAVGEIPHRPLSPHDSLSLM